MSRIVAILPVLALLPACSDLCDNTPVTRANAPGGQRSAVMFQRDCDATTGFSTQISILEPNSSPSGSGNAFRADDDHGAASAGPWGGSWAEMKWLAADHLLIRYAAHSRIFAQESEVSGVRITYQTVAHRTTRTP